MSGTKLDEGKLPWYLIPWDALIEIVKVLLFGASKYEERNWEKGINYDRLFAGVIRHLISWWNGETYDPETGLNHLAHACCGILFLLTYSIRGMYSFDNRPKTEATEYSPRACAYCKYANTGLTVKMCIQCKNLSNYKGVK